MDDAGTGLAAEEKAPHDAPALQPVVRAIKWSAPESAGADLRNFQAVPIAMQRGVLSTHLAGTGMQADEVSAILGAVYPGVSLWTADVQRVLSSYS
jgi:hypothetical protein